MIEGRLRDGVLVGKSDGRVLDDAYELDGRAWSDAADEATFWVIPG